MTSFPWSSAATSIVLYNRARHPSSYAFDGGGAGAIRAAGRPRPRGRGGASTSLSSPDVVAAFADDAPSTARRDAQAHVRGRAYILAAGRRCRGDDAGSLTFVSYGGGFGGGRSTSHVKAASASSSSSSPWLEPPPPPGRGARDDDNG
jgi:hypothetical protein